MSVRIRLRRDGAKKRPFYHVVAADQRRARNGRFIEELGYYNPMVAAEAEPKMLLKEDRIRYWLSVGAQPSETAAALLKKVGILERTQPSTPKAAAAPTEAPAAETAGPDASSAPEEDTSAPAQDEPLDEARDDASRSPESETSAPA